MTKPVILWIDDECERYDTLIAELRKRGVAVECAATYTEAMQKRRALRKYAAVMADIILPNGNESSTPTGRGFPSEPPPYWGLRAIESLIRNNKRGVPIIVFTIVNDPNVARQLESWRQQGRIAAVLEKGLVSLDDMLATLAHAVGFSQA
jgi:CheY-like chemotaxis protein